MEGVFGDLSIWNQHAFFMEVAEKAHADFKVDIVQEVGCGAGEGRITPIAEFVEAVRAAVMQAVSEGKCSVTLGSFKAASHNVVFVRDPLGMNERIAKISDSKADAKVVSVVQEVLKSLGVQWQQGAMKRVRLHILEWKNSSPVSTPRFSPLEPPEMASLAATMYADQQAGRGDLVIVSAEGEESPIHDAVFAISEPLKALARGGFSETATGRIVLGSLSLKVLQSLIKYLYLREDPTSELEPEQVRALLDFAQMYELNHLSALLINHIGLNVVPKLDLTDAMEWSDIPGVRTFLAQRMVFEEAAAS